MATESVLYHSSIRINGSKILYFDPFGVHEDFKDADYVFITHEHFDHFSPEDIQKVICDHTTLIIPASLEEKAQVFGCNVVVTHPGHKFMLDNISVEAIPAYTIGRPFHPKENNWLGYIVTMDNVRYYVAGDTDFTEDLRKLSCDVAFLPIGGKYTMDVKAAAELTNLIKPKKVIPTHYGSVAGAPEDGYRFAELVDPSILVEIQLFR